MNAPVEDLEALFDQVAAESAAKAPAEVPHREEEPSGDMYQRIGSLTRQLHDTLRELGYDRSLESAVSDLPDARDRLGYIAKLTGQAAERALAAVERGQALLKDDASAALGRRWDALHAGKLSVEEFKVLVSETRAHLREIPAKHAAVSSQFHEIMMAQDFHDLTGQVINRMLAMAQGLEQKLLQLLVEARPAGGEPVSSEWLGGPAMNAERRDDVVADQAQADALLESLGF